MDYYPDRYFSSNLVCFFCFFSNVFGTVRHIKLALCQLSFISYGVQTAGGRSGIVGGRSPGCFFWVLLKRSIPKPDQH